MKTAFSLVSAVVLSALLLASAAGSGNLLAGLFCPNEANVHLVKRGGAALIEQACGADTEPLRVSSGAEPVRRRVVNEAHPLIGRQVHIRSGAVVPGLHDVREPFRHAIPDCRVETVRLPTNLLGYVEQPFPEFIHSLARPRLAVGYLSKLLPAFHHASIKAQQNGPRNTPAAFATDLRAQLSTVQTKGNPA